MPDEKIEVENFPSACCASGASIFRPASSRFHPIIVLVALRTRAQYVMGLRVKSSALAVLHTAASQTVGAEVAFVPVDVSLLFSDLSSVVTHIRYHVSESMV